MSKKSHSNSQSGNVLILLIAAVVLLLAVIVFLLVKGPRASNLEPLPVAAYLETPGDFMGNTYAFRVQIDSQIQWDEAVGRLVAVIPEGSRGRVPVFVPESVERNLHIGQRYEMSVRIENGGLIHVEDLHKY